MITQSPYTPVKQMIFFIDYNRSDILTLKMDPNTATSQAIASIEDVFRKYDPVNPIDYEFADQDYASKFANEVRVGKLASIFAVLAIFISCLGLFGMASYVAEQRTKEIGIRKVLGASVANLWRMLSRDFVLLVLLSCIIAIPIAYHFLNAWLQQYEYRTEISYLVLAAAGLGSMVITLLTVSFQAIKAAIANPVNSLRSE
jgi:ABC-type antimicrobial peptide transport system permease subunit